MKTKKITGMAILAAIVIVLQSFSSIIPFNIPIALVHIPIVIGACLYGRKCGAFLGFVFGAVVLAFMWKNPFSLELLQLNPFAAVVLVLLKGTAAGWAAGIMYRLLCKKSVYLAGVLASVICPIVNTGIYIIGMITVFRSSLLELSGGGNLIVFLFTAFIGVNFLIELAINIVFAPAIVRIIKAKDRA